MHFPEELESKDFFKYMYKPSNYRKRNDVYIESVLFIAWVLIIALIINIYLFFIRNFSKKDSQKQRYTREKYEKSRRDSIN